MMVSYSKYSKYSRVAPRMDLTSDVIFSNRTEAMETLLTMLHKIERDGKVTMRYFLVLTDKYGEENMDIYDRIGWVKEDMSDFEIGKERFGWYIKSPRFRIFKKEENNEAD